MDQNLPVPKPNSRPIPPIISILSIFLAAAISSVSTYLFLNYQTLIKPKQTIQPNVSPSPSPVSVPTTDWKSYSNAVLNLSFKYPSELLLIEDLKFDKSTNLAPGVWLNPPFSGENVHQYEWIYISNSNIHDSNIMFIVPSHNDAIYNTRIGETYKDPNNSINLQTRLPDIAIDGNEARVFEYKQELNGPALATIIYLKRGDVDYVIENTYKNNPANFGSSGKTRDYYNQIFNQILSTFKFTN